MRVVRQKAAAAAVSASAVIVALQIVLPTAFDVVLGVGLVGLTWFVATVAPKG